MSEFPQSMTMMVSPNYPLQKAAAPIPAADAVTNQEVVNVENLWDIQFERLHEQFKKNSNIEIVSSDSERELNTEEIDSLKSRISGVFDQETIEKICTEIMARPFVDYYDKAMQPCQLLYAYQPSKHGGNKRHGLWNEDEAGIGEMILLHGGKNAQEDKIDDSFNTYQALKDLRRRYRWCKLEQTRLRSEIYGINKKYKRIFKEKVLLFQHLMNILD